MDAAGKCLDDGRMPKTPSPLKGRKAVLPWTLFHCGQDRHGHDGGEASQGLGRSFEHPSRAAFAEQPTELELAESNRKVARLKGVESHLGREDSSREGPLPSPGQAPVGRLRRHA